MKVSFNPADEKLATAFFERQVPIEVVEHGILMACTRKYMNLLTTPKSGLIVSCSYFKDAIEAAATSKVSNDYWRYLRQSISGLEENGFRRLASADSVRPEGRHSDWLSTEGGLTAPPDHVIICLKRAIRLEAHDD